MTTQWDRFQARNRQLAQEDLGFEDSVVIATPTESYTPGAGYTTSYTDENGGDPFDCETSLPSPEPDVDAGGTTETADITFHIRDDLSFGLTGYGESGEATARFKPVDTSKVYEVVTVEDERNGVLRVTAEEIDV